MPTKPRTTEKLSNIHCNRMVKIESVAGLPADVERLASLGIHVGAVVRVNRGGVTSIVELRDGSRLCIRPSSTLEILCIQTDEN